MTGPAPSTTASSSATPKGQTIIAYIAAANRDPDRFADPDRFDIHRTDTGHLAFGTGIHACLGGSLAQRLDQPRLDTDPPAYRTDIFRSLDTLPVSLAGIRPAVLGQTSWMSIAFAPPRVIRAATSHAPTPAA